VTLVHLSRKEEVKTAVSNTASDKAPGDEGMTPRVLIIGIPTAAQEQDGHLKPKNPNIN
jgi:hypothetical protein